MVFMKKVGYLLLWFSTGVQAETLVEVIQQTLETNPEVLVTTHQRLATDQEHRQAVAGYLPSVELNGGYGRETSDNVTTRARSDGEISLNRQELGLTLSQMLFDGFYVKREVEYQGLRIESAAHQVKNMAEQIGLLTTEMYVRLFQYHDLLELAKDNLVTHQKKLTQIREIVEKGAGRKADVQQCQSRLALASSHLVRSQGELREVEYRYQRVTGHLPQFEQLVKPERSLVEAHLPENVETALEIALKNHPTMKVAQAEWEAASTLHEQTTANFVPRFHLELSATDNKNLDGIEGTNDDLSAMVKMRYNLYRGGADQARREEVAERVSTAKEVVRRTRRTIEEEVQLAWNNLVTIRERLTYLEGHVEATKQVVESYSEQFKLGQRSLLDVLDSENELFNARSTLISGRYTELLGVFRLLNSMGLMLNKLGIELPKEARSR
jgi:adhesin transport system outer membrane protein